MRPILAVAVVSICILWSAGQRSEAYAQGKALLSEAQSFLGLSENDVVTKLGQPKRVERNDSPDGPFRFLEYSKEKGYETFFVIFESDGIVQSGYYKGTLFHDKQKR